MSIRLYVHPRSPRSFKVMALAAHLGVEHEIHVVDLGKGENKKPEFGAINPNRRVPVLEENGFRLWEANAILRDLSLDAAHTRSPRCATSPLSAVLRDALRVERAGWSPGGR